MCRTTRPDSPYKRSHLPLRSSRQRSSCTRSPLCSSTSRWSRNDSLEVLASNNTEHIHNINHKHVCHKLSESLVDSFVNPDLSSHTVECKMNQNFDFDNFYIRSTAPRDSSIGRGAPLRARHTPKHTQRAQAACHTCDARLYQEFNNTYYGNKCFFNFAS